MKKRRVVLIGGHELGCLCLDYLARRGYQVVLCLTRKDDSGEDNIFPSLLRVAKKHRVKCIRSARLDDPKVLKAVDAARADILLSLENNQIFREPWLNYFDGRLGIVNAHHGPLPRYGGFWPEVWAIWNREKNFGVTLHYVDGSIDGGNILAQKKVKISEYDTRRTLYDKCVQATFEIFKSVLPGLLEKKIMGKKQNRALRTYYKRGLPNDGFVDFAWNAEKIRRFFRAVSFYPFVGPKIKIGGRIISSLDQDLPFFKPVCAHPEEY